MQAIFDQAMKELRNHPFTLVVIIGLSIFAIYGYKNFASADEVQKVEAKIDRVLIMQLAETLRNLQAEYCRSNGNKATIRRTIEDYEQQYRELTGERYPLQDCQ